MNIQSKFAYVGFFAYLCSRKAAMGGKADMGYGIWDMGYRIWDMGYGRWAMGDGRWAMGDGRWVIGYRL